MAFELGAGDLEGIASPFEAQQDVFVVALVEEIGRRDRGGRSRDEHEENGRKEMAHELARTQERRSTRPRNSGFVVSIARVSPARWISIRTSLPVGIASQS